MPSHSRSPRSRYKIGNTKASTGQVVATRQVARPLAPSELDAALGPGTSNTFPLFMAGFVTLIKKLFSR
ncbi:MAG TPA: hypothetical protein VKR06_18150 [Ktedonosporobacter sp.]|nr:hypothetical protein [Ktedonosporobacter sp.]